MGNCYLCNISLSAENSAKEHIFLNAIGGKLKSEALICRNCNIKFGEEIDFELSEQLKPIANLFNIKRDDGQLAKPFYARLKSGEKIRMATGGKPIANIMVKEEKTNEGIEIHIQAPNNDEFGKILRGFKNKYPQIDMERFLDSVATKHEYLTENLSLEVPLGGVAAFRSLCKTAAHFYIFKNGSFSNINHIIPFIKGESESSCVFFHYPKYEIIERQQSEVLHSIIIAGNETEKILYAYIELFNFYRVIVLLNDNYDGEKFNHSYFYDILNHKEIKKCFNLSINREMLLKQLNDRIIPLNEIKEEFNKIHKIWHEKAKMEYLEQMIENILKKHPDDLNDPEVFSEFITDFSKEIAPWFIANF